MFIENQFALVNDVFIFMEHISISYIIRVLKLLLSIIDRDRTLATDLLIYRDHGFLSFPYDIIDQLPAGGDFLY